VLTAEQYLFPALCAGAWRVSTLFYKHKLRSTHVRFQRRQRAHAPFLIWGRVPGKVCEF